MVGVERAEGGQWILVEDSMNAGHSLANIEGAERFPAAAINRELNPLRRRVFWDYRDPEETPRAVNGRFL